MGSPRGAKRRRPRARAAPRSGAGGHALIRPARPGEAADLTALALRAKAHWGYDRAFLDSVREMLTFSEADIERGIVFVLEQGGNMAGVYQVIGEPPEGELWDLWLDPAYIGHGHGRALFEHALRTARARGFSSLVIEADPNAEAFYLAMGAERIGVRQSASERYLPLLRVGTGRA